MLLRMKVGERILAQFAVSTALMILICAIGWFGMSSIQGSLRNVFETSVVPLAGIARVAESYFDARVAIASLTGRSSVTSAEVNAAKARISADKAEGDKDWAAYRKIPAPSDEMALADGVEAAREAYESTEGQALADVEKGDLSDAKLLSESKGSETFEAFKAAFRKLEAKQIEEAGAEHAGANALFGKLRMLFVATILCAIGFGTWLSFRISGSIKRPLTALIRVMSSLKSGDLAVDITGTERPDELGDAARSVEVFRQGMVEAERMRNEQERMRLEAEAERERVRQAEADAERRKHEEEAAQARLQAERAQKLAALAEDFDRKASGLLETVASAATELNMTARSLNENADQANHHATIGASASEQTAANVETVASAAEELSASVHEISKQVQRSAAAAGRAVGDADRTAVLVHNLSTAADRINQVVALIESIANQTNLLALNATIEAARAGEAGKGFAVVASEVKTLADQTAKATGDIAEQISNIQAATEETVTAISGIREVIIEINEIAGAVAAAVEEQGAATNEISRNVQQAAEGTRQVSTTIRTVTTSVAETGTSAVQVLAASDELSVQSERLKSDVTAFLLQIQAA